MRRKNQPDIERIISDYFEGSILPEESMMLEAWLSESIINQEYYSQLGDIYYARKRREIGDEVKKF